MKIPATMRAVRLHQPCEPVTIEEVPVPSLGARDVLVRVEASGLNGGDVHLAVDGSIPLHVLPLTIGHETAGTVAAVGPEVGRLKVGDRVHCDPVLSCLTCENCMAGRRMACASGGVSGMSYFGYTEHGLARFERYAHGSCAEYVRLPEENVEPLSDQTPFDVASKFGVLGTGYRAVKAAGVQPHHTVIVTAATGGTGAATLLCARFAGAKRVIAVSRTRSALDRLKETIGEPLETVCTSEEEVGGRITELTEGMGADVLIDYAPADTELTGRLISYLKPGGCAVLGGGTPQSMTIEYQAVMVGSLTIVGTHAYTPSDIRELDALVADGRLRVDQLITHRFPLVQTADALDKMGKREGHPLWVIIEPRT